MQTWVFLFFLIAGLSAFLSSCDPCAEPNCPYTYGNASLHFHFISKKNGQDLFFSSNPTYKYSDLLVYGTDATGDSVPIEIYENAFPPPGPGYFQASFSFRVKNLYIKVDTLKIDSITANWIPIIQDCCSRGSVVKEIRLDGELLRNSCLDTTNFIITM